MYSIINMIIGQEIFGEYTGLILRCDSGVCGYTARLLNWKDIREPFWTNMIEIDEAILSSDNTQISSLFDTFVHYAEDMNVQGEDQEETGELKLYEIASASFQIAASEVTVEQTISE